jgi:hypothetical protein
MNFSKNLIRDELTDEIMEQLSPLSNLNYHKQKELILVAKLHEEKPSNTDNL